MPRYLVELTVRKAWWIEADDPLQAVSSGANGNYAIHVDKAVVRREPALLLAACSLRTFRVEYRKGGTLVFAHVTKRVTPHEVREHAEKVLLMLAEMKKPADEVRIRELKPRSMLRREP